jgi:circadian clock protein KaiC
MTTPMKHPDWRLRKRPTRIEGLDGITHGGLPDRQTTLVVGEMGTGKTVLGLQVLAHTITDGGSGLFISFEESPEQIRRNADSFDWGQELNTSNAWSLIDARIQVGAEQAGAFEIDALLLAIESQARKFSDPWVVVDGIDQLLQHEPSRAKAIDQVRQLNERCENMGWTLLLSGKGGHDGLSPKFLEGIEFMLPTVLRLSAAMINRRLHRHIRVAKYRGSSHAGEEVPLIINHTGVCIPFQPAAPGAPVPASTERVGTGVPRLDELLAGGPFRGSSMLISGRPGTAKSTLAAGFAETAAARGERALYVSFDEMQAPFVRNLASVGIDLQPHIDGGRVRFSARTAAAGVIAEHVLELLQTIEEFEPHVLIIDPVSALRKASGGESACNAVERILALTRQRGITAIMTSLADEEDAEGEATLTSVSTIADTWIVLDHNVRAGERNRALSIVKSRGSAHSNQQRELLLTDRGVDLADVYEYGTEVLMGTARAQKESEDRETETRRAIERSRRRRDLEHRIERAQDELERLMAELGLEDQRDAESDRSAQRHTERMKRRREPDPGRGTVGDSE